ncbi:MAG: hypothetical protein SOI41_07315 [Heyndrickxia coagulans]
MANLKEDESQPELDWDFYFFIGNTLLGLRMNDFWDITPNHLLKQFVMWLKFNAPNALKQEKTVVTLDQTPFL